jgi:poly(A) polymerase
MTERDDFVAAFVAAGYQLWVVGGALRDDLLGIADPAKRDEDFATDASPEAIEAIAQRLGRPVTTVGKKFGTIGVLIDGRWTEVTTFRGDAYSDGSRWPDVTFGRTIEDDLARRDFTINALARNAVTGETLDLFGGQEDLARRLIRAVGDPATRFREDPLRILRGLRFASQLAFDIDAATLAGMRETAPLLATLSQERVTAELERLLTGADPARGLDLLRETGGLAVVLPELAPMVGCEQNHWHRFDVWGHSVATVAAMPADEEARVRRWAALLHDLGKPAVRHRKPDGEWGFFRHDVVGAAMARRLLDRLKVARRDAGAIELLVRRHMDRPDPGEPKQVRRFIARSEGRWRDLVALKRADNTSHTYDDRAYHDALWAACERQEAEQAAALRAESPLSGDDLVALAGRPPGPWIRPIKERLSAMVLDGDLAPGDRDAAAVVARQMLDAT